MLQKDVRVTAQRERHRTFASFFVTNPQPRLCYCNDVEGLFNEMNIPYSSNDWRLFIDGSTKSLKAVLLHNAGFYPSIPLAHACHLKEEYSTIKRLLELLEYSKYEWEVIGDFKMISILMGLQGGYTKFPCYLCLWDSRDDDNHFNKKKKWPRRTQFVIGENNVKSKPLVPVSKILMPPLHLKLGLMKQFVKGLKKDSLAFAYLKELFPRLSIAKITSGIFVGPQIRKIMSDSEFPKLLTPVERKAWKSFVNVCGGFLGNHRAPNFEELVQTMVKNYSKMGCRMSYKLHIMNAHLDHFKNHMGHYSEEQGERFHQDIMNFEKRYQGKPYDENMMGDYIWSLTRDPTKPNKRQSRGNNCFKNV